MKDEVTPGGVHPSSFILRQPLCPVDEAGQLVEAGLPESRVAEIDAKRSQEVGRAPTPATGEKLQVARNKRRSLRAVHPVQREHQQLPEDIGIGIEAGADKVR